MPEIINYQNMVPDQDNTLDLGKTTKRFRSLYLASNLTDGTDSVTVAQLASLVSSPGGVSSVSNSDGTITSSPTSGAVILSRPAITGDITIAGGSNASVLATVATAGTTGSSTAIPVITINAKGLTTSITTAAVVAPAGTLTGTTLASNVVTSSLTAVGTIATGVWNGTAITVANGGTGDTSLTAYAVLCGGTTSTAAVQSIAGVGTSGQVLTSNGAGALPTFQTATGGVTSVTATNTTLTISPTTGAVLAGINLSTANTWTGAITMGTTTKIQFTDTNAFINASSSGTLVVQGATDTQIGVAGDIQLGDGTLRALIPNTTEKINLGSSGARFLNQFLGGDLDLDDASNLVLGTTTGTKFGTATTQKLSFYNATPVVQPAGTTDVLASLVTLGLRAASSNPALNLGTGTITCGAGVMSSKLTTYNNIATVSNGVPSELATVDLTGQSAAIAATTLYAVPSTGLGLYRVSWVATVTTVDGTSSTLGGAAGFQLKYTDGDDSVVKTSAPTTVTFMTSAGNTTATSVSGTFNAYCKASTNLQYLFGYTSALSQMRYNLHIKLEALG